MSNENRFKYLSNEPPATIPEGAEMQLSLKTSREVMGERLYFIANSKTCECCGGRGRVALPE